MNFSLTQIGKIINDNNGFQIQIDNHYIPALTGLDGYSHIQVICWFDKCDNIISRDKLLENKPYTNGPDILGAFATRSPERPNPIAISCAYITYIDYEKGIIGLAYTDAFDGTPVIDIKPYVPSIDRVETPSVPKWCNHWPNCTEKSGDFDWDAEFNF